MMVSEKDYNKLSREVYSVDNIKLKLTILKISFSALKLLIL